MSCSFNIFIFLVCAVYNRSAPVPGHQLISRPPRQCPHLCQEASADGQPGAPCRGAPPLVQAECQLCQDSRAQGAGTGWKHLHRPVFGNWWVSNFCEKTKTNNAMILLSIFCVDKAWCNLLVCGISALLCNQSQNIPNRSAAILRWCRHLEPESAQLSNMMFINPQLEIVTYKSLFTLFTESCGAQLLQDMTEPSE